MSPILPTIHAWPRAAAARLLSVLLATTATGAPLPAELVTPTLERRSLEVLSVANGRLRSVDDDRSVADTSLRGVVRLSFDVEPPDPDASPAGRLLLTDGQVLSGEPGGAEGGGESIAWRHPRLGDLAVPLERVASVRLAAAAGPAALGRAGPPATDELHLANGDVLLGFAVSTGPAGVAFEPDGGAAATIPWDAVASLRLANPPAAPPAGDFVELADGSRFAASARFDGSAWTLTDPLPGLSPPVDPLAALPPSAVAAVEPGAAGLRLLGLDAVAVEEPEPAVAFGVAFPARRVDAGLRLHAPTRVTLSAPAGTVRRVEVRLALAAPADDSPLASVDADLGGAPVRLDAPRPAATLTLEPSGDGPIVLTLGEAEHGPVLDRVLVESIEMLIDTR